ncbi:MAG: hypothetical protein ACI95K_002171, partial [Lentimonas sp.]
YFIFLAVGITREGLSISMISLSSTLDFIYFASQSVD